MSIKIAKWKLGAVALAGALFSAYSSSADAYDPTQFNVTTGKETREQAGGGFRIFIYGNSIAKHDRLDSIGWYNDWGMAASAREKDFAHIIITNMEATVGTNANYVIRNLAALETSPSTFDVATTLADDIALGADYIVIALGENTGSGSQSFEDKLVELANAFKIDGHSPRIVFRSPFWRNATCAAYVQNAATRTNSEYVDAGPLGDDDTNKAIGLFDHSGVANHPGDKGMIALAELILPALKTSDPVAPVDDPTNYTSSVYNDTDPVGDFTAIGGEQVDEAPATGGIINRLNNGDYVHTFIGSGNFIAPANTNLHVTCLVIGGGGGGGNLDGGGGGAGGVVLRELDVPSGSTIQVTVGAGGAGATSAGYSGSNGGNSTVKFSTSNDCAITAFGGGKGAGWGAKADPSATGNGGSGGGMSIGNSGVSRGQPISAQGYPGGLAAGGSSAGGGGAGGAGGDGASGQAGNGGPGILCAISGAMKRYATGGGAGAASSSPVSPMVVGSAGKGGSDGVCGGNGSVNTSSASPGVANTGAGGGGGGWTGSPGSGGNGGSGVVIIRYSYVEASVSDEPIGDFEELGDEGASEPDAPLSGGKPYRLSNGEFVHVFTSSGQFTAPSDTNLHIRCLAVGGGGGGGDIVGGGGGAGGVVLREFDLPAGAQVQVTVGTGGTGGSHGTGYHGGKGGDTSLQFSTSNECMFVAYGGGGGGGWDEIPTDGGSGGGMCIDNSVTCSQGVEGQGYGGGIASGGSSAGGGGAAGPGRDGASG